MGLPDAKIVVQDGGLGVRGPLATGVFAAVGAAPNKAAAVAHGKVLALSNPRKAHELLGAGPLRDLAVAALSLAGTVVYAVPLAQASAAGTATVTGVSKSGKMIRVLDATGTAAAAARHVEVAITKAGALGTAEATFAVDGVKLAPVVIADAGSNKSTAVTPEGSGVELVWEAVTADFDTADKWTVRCSRYGEPSNGDVLAAIDTLLASQHRFEWISVAGESTMALWASLATKAASALTRHRHLHFKSQARYPEPRAAAWAEALASAAVRGTTSDTRVQVYASWMRYADPITGKVEVRGVADAAAGLSARRRAHEPVDAVRYGAIPGATGMYPDDVDDAAVATVDGAGYATVRTYAGRRGIYVTRARMLAPAGSDYQTEERRRVMDRACTVVRAAQLRYLNDTAPLGPDGTLSGIDLFRRISQQPLEQMVREGQVSSAAVEIDPLQDILSTETVETEIAVVPLGKLANIRTTLSYRNPLLERVAAGQAPAADAPAEAE